MINAHRGKLLAQEFIWVAQLEVHRAGDPGLNPGPGENLSLKLTTLDLSDGFSENQILILLKYFINYLFTFFINSFYFLLY